MSGAYDTRVNAPLRIRGNSTRDVRKITRTGWRTALFYTRAFNRILRPGLAQILPLQVPGDTPLRRGFDKLDALIDRWIEQKKVPA